MTIFCCRLTLLYLTLPLQSRPSDNRTIQSFVKAFVGEIIGGKKESMILHDTGRYNVTNLT